jgi:hypothetical protein
MNRAVVSSYTARTTAFATATGITDTTILSALNTFDLGLISNSLDSKMKALYPFVGGTATAHKYNFMNALDTNGAFRLQFNGGWTHSSTGAMPNGINTYADTFLNPSLSLSQNSTHLSYYSRTNVLNTSHIEMGVFPVPSGVGASCFGISLNIVPLGHFRNRISTSTASTSYIPSSTTGLFISNRTISTEQKVYKNGTLQETANINSNGIANINISISGLRIDSTTVTDYSAKQVAFSSIGDGLSDGEATTFYNLIQTMQTTLSRNV